jgi:hypothetical protein
MPSAASVTTASTSAGTCDRSIGSSPRIAGSARSHPRGRPPREPGNVSPPPVSLQFRIRSSSRRQALVRSHQPPDSARRPPPSRWHPGRQHRRRSCGNSSATTTASGLTAPTRRSSGRATRCDPQPEGRGRRPLPHRQRNAGLSDARGRPGRRTAFVRLPESLRPITDGSKPGRDRCADSTHCGLLGSSRQVTRSFRTCAADTTTSSLTNRRSRPHRLRPTHPLHLSRVPRSSPRQDHPTLNQRNRAVRMLWGTDMVSGSPI